MFTNTTLFMTSDVHSHMHAPCLLYSFTAYSELYIQSNQISGVVSIYTLSHHQPTIHMTVPVHGTHALAGAQATGLCIWFNSHSLFITYCPHTPEGPSLKSSPRPLHTSLLLCNHTTVVTCVEEGAGLGRTTHTGTHLLVC